MGTTGSRIRQLAAYVKENPRDSFSKFALALECRKMDRLEQAQVLFENIRREDPDYAGVYYHLGKLYELRGMEEKALECYTEGIGVADKQRRTRTRTELAEALKQLESEIENR